MQPKTANNAKKPDLTPDLASEEREKWDEGECSVR
jgi:hypothetical protein